MPIAYLADEPLLAKECRRCRAAFRSKCRGAKFCPACREALKVERRIPYQERKKRRLLSSQSLRLQS